MKVALYHSDRDTSVMVSEKLVELLRESKIEIDDKNPDVVITIGGDGTLLSAVQEYLPRLDRVRFVGVHTGHLGFYTDWRDYELTGLVEALVRDQGEEVGYPMLDINVKYADGSISKFYAVNESTIKKLSGTLVADVYIGDELFERFRGDGLCLSTPTGSTAYNRSVGGAIVHPRLEVLQMAEIASINNRVFKTVGASLIMAPNETVTIRPVTAGGTFNFTADRIDVVGEAVLSVDYRISTRKVKFIKYRHTGFWNRVRNAFIGNIDDI
ncbi:NAD kinase [Pediococcus claussenii]|uniref:NAD kinase n=1 Tax=Pediococcus claussenii (strain ATCC BAA-344 / DSM 14800 / JCM 18046 / KCTC 3811 / LMG 21948 / P06) TaxID=701521 RepID=G8PCS7_PEDCP|nr:NAD kinase [Pediococcus claussenii]AEV95062.1 ATP-NAD kinase family protein [Pediococcus claussenii ATCC BAA-344]ANZ70250.1 NAD kinase [Pediococcus claussenii]ANZ72066.1 NAD kinase [Pediococcus claussenii]KRN18923.1 hypothetical protein IV79_GL001766 [Pediococcus claussenii]